ncbi:hypothetical protein A3I34_02240 [Candidatus Jorgensenbacteria bacterium RIFCSPLOWO2_02_FULL_45_12]|uniref:Uncharacterized protein n=2 Tax=Candidatus Joergenseniibacteriota TaxID=1752739 RepID=A0A1F6BPD5_9BACT|nr:MAG: hypothetical protein UX22_C0016G0002 [Candidatus Jorgensenbacteria bacterium GW2011_GWA2_45_9]OGG38789.1 MAG: hypothetical protein A3D55_01090 [Candidatus Jorgensenbacteria bacterium RIFCSPHIGHO2_02_FULL_45_20]OGG42181.1 MAG: hypothetical protein A3I34_02240 [Candidatus Jorgensenbacteria bacterium RIFCSPLOWO2_02_FULL_45_12]
MNKKTSTYIAIGILIFAAGAVIGFWVGLESGKKMTNTKLQKIVDMMIPKPDAVMFSLTGTLKEIHGATLVVEVQNPDDYLPHTDDTAPTMEMRYASLTDSTKIFITDAAKFDTSGRPEISEVKSSDLKIGSIVTVRSDKNIRNKKNFDATQVEAVRY